MSVHVKIEMAKLHKKQGSENTDVIRMISVENAVRDRFPLCLFLCWCSVVSLWALLLINVIFLINASV